MGENNPNFKYNILKNFLIKQYIKNKKSTYEIAKKIGCSYNTIRNKLIEYNISRRTKRETNQNRKGKYKISEQAKLNIKLKHADFSGQNNPMYGIHNCGEKHWNWQGGISGYASEFNKSLKELIRDRDNHKCQECGCPEIECYRKLDVHHIDYNKENCNKKNLISLCSNCNLKVNYNRNYWEKYFKKLIEEKYKCNMVK